MAEEIITVTGIAEAAEFLRNAPKVVVATAFLKAFRAGGEVIKEDLISRTPIKSSATGGLLREGELQASVELKIQLDSQFRGGVAIISHGKNSNVANWVEFGHILVGHKPGKKVLGVVPEHPFIRPCADATWQAAVEAFTDSLVESMRENFQPVEQSVA